MDMKIVRYLALILLLFAMQFNLHARENKYIYGWSPKVALLSVDDPDGNTETSSDAQLLSGFLFYSLDRDTRVAAIVTKYDFELAPGFGKIGQDVESTSIAIFYQSQFKWHRHFKPWLGIGGVFNFDKFTNRVTTDEDGFLVGSYDDREETTVNLGLIASKEWSISDTFELGLNIEYLVSLGDTLEGFTVGMSFLYK